MSETGKIIISIVGGICGAGFLTGLFKYIIIAYFKNRDKTIEELIIEKNKQAICLTKLKTDFKNLKDNLEELKNEHRENH